MLSGRRTSAIEGTATFRSRARGTKGAEGRTQFIKSLPSIGGQRTRKKHKQQNNTSVAVVIARRGFSNRLILHKKFRVAYGYWLWIR
jgi:hypothetical protein